MAALSDPYGSISGNWTAPPRAPTWATPSSPAFSSPSWSSPSSPAFSSPPTLAPPPVFRPPSWATPRSPAFTSPPSWATPASAAWQSPLPWARSGGGMAPAGSGGFFNPDGSLKGGSGPLAIKPPAKPARPSYNPEQDPSVIAARNAAARRQASASASRNAARKTAIIRLGIDPNDTSVLAKLGFALDPNDLAAAEANYRSGNAITARLSHGNDLARRALLNQLAARGMLGSGDTGYLETEQGRAYGNQTYDAWAQTQDYLQQVQQQWLAEQEAATEMVDQALAAAVENERSQQAYFDAYYSSQQQQQSPFAGLFGATR